MRYKIILLIITGIVILYTSAVTVSETNWACGTCHTAEHERWAVSSHQTIDCEACHIDPGIGGAFDAQMNGMQNLFVSITSGNTVQPHEDPIPISTENCMECHAAILYFNELGFEDTPDNTLKGQGLLIGHRIHVEKHAIDCVECHRGIVHRDPGMIGKYPRNWPMMHTDCSICHEGQYLERFDMELPDVQDQAECAMCHPTYEPPTYLDIIKKQEN
ncbi:cytochrome c3 family protein [candidate division KSB1 bacterium]